MLELPEIAEVRSAWRNQPVEEVPVDIEQIHSGRMWELFSTTRSEIFNSMGAALFFSIVVAWRFGSERDHLLPLACAGAAVFVAVTLLRFRYSLRRHRPDPDALADTGLDHYRAELRRRRDHLRNAWIWHGPLWLAGLLSAVILAGRIVPARLWNALPIFLFLVCWEAIGIRRRNRQAAELQREIDEIACVSSTEE